MSDFMLSGGAAPAGTYGTSAPSTVPMGSMVYECDTPGSDVFPVSRQLHNDNGLTIPVIAELPRGQGRLPRQDGYSPDELGDVRPENPFTSVGDLYGSTRPVGQISAVQAVC